MSLTKMQKSLMLASWLQLSLSIWGQPASDEIDRRLAESQGRERIELLVELAATYREEDAERAIELGEEAIDLLRLDPDRRQQLEILNSLAYAHVTLGNHEPALNLGSQARDLAGELDDPSARAFALRNIGRVYRSSSEYDRALQVYELAAELYANVGEKLGLGDALNDQGVVFWMRGDYPKALDYFIQARRHYETAGDPRRIAAILNNTGMIHRRLGQNARALELYHEALDLRREVGPARSLANVLNNIGNVHRDQQDSALALEYYLESLAVGAKDKYSNSNTLINVGAAYQNVGDLDRAGRYFDQALDAKEAIGDEHGVAGVLLQFGSLQRQRGDYGDAIASLRRSLAIYQELDTKDEAKDAHLQLAETYAAMGQHRQALADFRAYERVKSEIFNRQNSTMIAEMEARFESERKERKIEILKQEQALADLELERQKVARRALYGGLVLLSLVTGLLYNRYRLRTRTSRVIERQNRELAQAMVELKESEHERRRLQREQVRQEERERYIAELEAKNKEVEARNAEIERFAYTLSHDLKTPLVTIRGFLGMLRKDTQTGDRDRMASDVERIDAAVHRMARLLDELLEMLSVGHLVEASQEVALGELAKEAVQQLSEYGLGALKIEIAPDLPIVSGDRQRLLEVLRNLIENAVQFTAHQQEPRVEVGCRGQQEETIIYVRDNGIGIEPRYHEKVFGLFERLNAQTKGTGVGLALVKRIIESHGGRIWVESKGSEHGSTFCFQLPIAPARRG